MSKKPVKLRIRQAVFVSLVGGVLSVLIVTGLIMNAAWDHNPQQEYHEPGNIHWDPRLFLGFLWFAMVGGGFSLVLSIVSVGIIWLFRRSLDPTSEGV